MPNVPLFGLVLSSQRIIIIDAAIIIIFVIIVVSDGREFAKSSVVATSVVVISVGSEGGALVYVGAGIRLGQSRREAIDR